MCMFVNTWSSMASTPCGNVVCMYPQCTTFENLHNKMVNDQLLEINNQHFVHQ